ncbi:diguanylate cyclase domain-containing protein [Sulfurimonas sp.]|uniref:diguanylate cyclase domain-containing protein n=1 Tax=Sulfurimonas sp. TaxID=2022749 RepID=UPI0035618DE8
MFSFSKIKNIVLVIIITLITPIILGTVLNSIVSERFISIPLHSVIETSGGIIAIVISMIFYVKSSKEHILNHFNFSTTALLAMGIIDIFHASVMPGKMFVWLHSTAVFFGGLFFISVWLKNVQVSRKVYISIPVLFIVFPIIFSLLSIYFHELIPPMLNDDNSFTTAANFLNIIGGIGFFIASVKFISNYMKTNNLDELLFAGHTMLFGIAGVLFLSSVVWDAQWWLWHILRLLAYIIAFYFLYKEYKDEIEIVEKTNVELEIANDKIVEYLDIVDKNVITSTTDTKGVIIKASQAFCDISGYSKDELIGKHHNIVRHPDMPKELYKELWSYIKNGKQWSGEILNRRKNGSSYWVETTITPQYDKNNNLISFTSIRHDITDKKNIEILSITDELTNLYNRRFFNKTIEKEINRARRDGKFLSFMILDVDHFKLYNDTYGHIYGDTVLKKIGEVLSTNTKRTSDYAFRLGGEEFGIIFSGVNKECSFEFAKKIIKEIEELKIPHEKNSASKYVTASAGLIVKKDESLKDSDNIYASADQLLYEAKESGRNKVII